MHPSEGHAGTRRPAAHFGRPHHAKNDMRTNKVTAAATQKLQTTGQTEPVESTTVTEAELSPLIPVFVCLGRRDFGKVFVPQRPETRLMNRKQTCSFPVLQ